MPRVPPFDRPATWDDLVLLPDILIAEIVNGELHGTRRHPPRFLLAASGLARRLASATMPRGVEPGDWWVFHLPEVHDSGNVLVPDIAAWSRSRLSRLPEHWQQLPPPDWVCEVVSPVTVEFDRHCKLPAYARADIRYTWLIDPLARTLEVLRLENGRWTILATHAGDEVVRAEPFDAIALELTALWTDTAEGGPVEPETPPPQSPVAPLTDLLHELDEDREGR